MMFALRPTLGVFGTPPPRNPPIPSPRPSRSAYPEPQKAQAYVQHLESWKKGQYAGIGFGCSRPERAQTAFAMAIRSLFPGPPELILFLSAAQDENLSIKVPGSRKTCHQSTTKPLKIGVLDPPPHHSPDMGRAIRVQGR